MALNILNWYFSIIICVHMVKFLFTVNKYQYIQIFSVYFGSKIHVDRIGIYVCMPEELLHSPKPHYKCSRLSSSSHEQLHSQGWTGPFRLLAMRYNLKHTSIF